MGMNADDFTVLPIIGKVTLGQLSQFSNYVGVATMVTILVVLVALKFILFPSKVHKTAKQIIDEAAPDALKGKTVIVTGGNSGIGLEACKALLLGGARVIMCSRSIPLANKAIEQEILQPGEGGYVATRTNLVVKELDLNSLKSIKKFADDILATEKKIDILVLNAGIMALPKREETDNGFEKQIGVNHFGHAYLERLLEDRLAEGKTATAPGRIIVLSSIAHNMGTVGDCSDLHYNKGRKYEQWGAYGQSKQANLLFASALDARFSETKKPLVAVSLHPGKIQTTLWRSTGVASGIGAWIASIVVMDKTIPQGAATTVWACVAPEVLSPSIRGGYLVDCAQAIPTTRDARDEDGQRRAKLWEVTNQQLDAALEKLAASK